MTSVQAESVRGLGAWHGGLYVRFSYPLLPISFAYDIGFLDPWLGMVRMRRRRRRTSIDRERKMELVNIYGDKDKG